MKTNSAWYKSAITKGIIFGICFGALFPLIATILDIILRQSPINWNSIVMVQSSQPLHWIIDSAPLFLGIFGGLVGMRQQKIIGLNKHRHILGTIIDATQEAIIAIDSQGKISLFNRAAEAMFGQNKDEIIGQPLDKLMPEEYRRPHRQYVSGYFETGKPDAAIGRIMELPGLRSDGTVFPMEISLSSCRSDGQVMVAAVARDITERKLTEEKISGINDVFVKFGIDASENIGIIVKQTCDLLDGVCSMYNRLDEESKSLLTWSRHNAPSDLSDECQPDGHICYEVTIKGQNQPVVIEELRGTSYEESDPNVKKYSLRSYLGYPVCAGGKTIGSLCIVDTRPRRFSSTDVHIISTLAKALSLEEERRQAEEQKTLLNTELDRARRMESLGVLAGGVAHDLNNMLGPLVAYPELIMEKLPEGSPLKRQIQCIGQAARKAAEVIQDLLALARRGQYEMMPTDLNKVIEAYLESSGFLKLTQAKPHVNVNTKLDFSIANINGSFHHLTKVVMNLIVSAYDSISESGGLTIETSQKEISRLFGGFGKIKPGNYVVLKVRDTGHGIDPDDLDKIFEPYYSKRKMGTGGSGLGMSVVYGIIKDHKGYYDIFSSMEEGTEFIVYLPVISKEAVVESVDENDYHGTESILVVDDLNDQREIAEEVLSSLGYSVTSVASGREAVSYLEKNTADLIVLDMIMEDDFDGLDTFREIIRLNPGQKVIIVSGFSATERVAEILKMGGGIFIKKPFTRREISKAIRRILDQQAPVRVHPSDKARALAAQDGAAVDV